MIIKFFKWLIGSWCEHKWVVLQRIEFYETGQRLPNRFCYHLQCEKCGNIKKGRV